MRFLTIFLFFMAILGGIQEGEKQNDQSEADHE
jgi:hypothetical protein